MKVSKERERKKYNENKIWLKHFELLAIDCLETHKFQLKQTKLKWFSHTNLILYRNIVDLFEYLLRLNEKTLRLNSIFALIFILKWQYTKYIKHNAQWSHANVYNTIYKLNQNIFIWFFFIHNFHQQKKL